MLAFEVRSLCHRAIYAIMPLCHHVSALLLPSCCRRAKSLRGSWSPAAAAAFPEALAELGILLPKHWLLKVYLPEVRRGARRGRAGSIWSQLD